MSSASEEDNNIVINEEEENEEEEEEEEEKNDPKDKDFNPYENTNLDSDESFTAADDSEAANPWNRTNDDGPILAVEKDEDGEIYITVATENGEKRMTFAKARTEYPQEIIQYFENHIQV